LCRQPVPQLTLKQNFIPAAWAKSGAAAFQALSAWMDRPTGCGSVNANEQGSILCYGLRSAETTVKLDRIDIKILYELQKNGRITNVELADLVHLSPSPCLMRVKKLQSEGYIEGYSAQVNIGKLGQTLTVFTEITLKNHRQVDFARFLAVVEKIDQVIECHLVSGGYDYLMKFVTAGIAEYQTIMERLTDMDIGIDKYFSFVVLKSPIIKAHMPLPSLFPR
jgi:DNA-binding Lrp family transcriptional regulator